MQQRRILTRRYKSTFPFMTAGSDVKLVQVGPAISFRLQQSTKVSPDETTATTVSAPKLLWWLFNHTLVYKAELIQQGGRAYVLRNERKSIVRPWIRPIMYCYLSFAHSSRKWWNHLPLNVLQSCTLSYEGDLPCRFKSTLGGGVLQSLHYRQPIIANFDFWCRCRKSYLEASIYMFIHTGVHDHRKTLIATVIIARYN